MALTLSEVITSSARAEGPCQIYEQNGTTAYAGAEDLAYGNQPQHQHQTGYAAYPETGYGEYPQQPQHVLYPASPYEEQNQGQTLHPNQAAYQDQNQVPVAPMNEGLHDGMMVRVDVGFARTLEDELGEWLASMHSCLIREKRKVIRELMEMHFPTLFH